MTYSDRVKKLAEVIGKALNADGPDCQLALRSVITAAFPEPKAVRWIIKYERKWADNWIADEIELSDEHTCNGKISEMKRKCRESLRNIRVTALYEIEEEK